MGLYFLAGDVIDTHVQHCWMLPGGPGPEQTLFWIRPGYWVVEVEDEGEGQGITDGTPIWGIGRPSDQVWQSWYVYRVAEADALAMLARYGHGPNIWTCACTYCRCPCGESFHTHPLLFLEPGELRGSCTRLHLESVYAVWTRAYLERQTNPAWSPYDSPAPLASAPRLSPAEAAMAAMMDRESLFSALWCGLCELRAMHYEVRNCLRVLEEEETVQAAERLLARRAHLDTLIDERDARLRELDPDRARWYLDKFYAQHPDGTPDWTRRVG